MHLKAHRLFELYPNRCTPRRSRHRPPQPLSPYFRSTKVDLCPEHISFITRILAFHCLSHPTQCRRHKANPFGAARIQSSRSPAKNMQLYLLDYGAGNVTSLANSLKKLGYDFRWIESAEDFDKANVS